MSDSGGGRRLLRRRQRGRLGARRRSGHGSRRRRRHRHDGRDIANTYQLLGKHEQALLLRRDVHAGQLRILGWENINTLTTTNNYASLLKELQRYEEAKSLICKTMPVARRVLGEFHEVTIKMLWVHADILCENNSSTLDDLRELLNTLEDSARGAKQVYGASHPFAKGFLYHIECSRLVIAARETPSPGSP